jgi:outer membrane protein assembly factor BamB
VLVIGVGGLGTRDNGVALPQSQLETFRGSIQGVDTRTGKKLWQLDTTPEPAGAGVSVWSSAALDTTRKLAFIGTGNNYYRPVSELSDSLVAVDYLTGQKKWHSQFTMNDAWTVGTVLQGGVDGDVGATPNLFSIEGRDVVGVGDKPGSYHVRDRETGAVVWSKKLTSGGYQGGVMAPAAVHDGVIYVISNNDTASSTVFALNARDGAPLWEVDLTDPTFGGPALGNGVLYVGDQAGNVRALASKDGKELWRTRVPQGRGGGFTLVDGMLFTGYGFHFSESRREPLTGGLLAYSLTGTATPPPVVGEQTDCVPDTPVTNAPTFSNVYQGVLCAAGCTKVCHSSSMEAGLRLDQRAIAHRSLVNVAAAGAACKTGGHQLVVPGNHAASLLYGKLALTPACGVGMPPTATAATTPITSAMLEAVRAWIAAGAPDN